MGDAGYRGVSADQDGRFRNKETKLLKQLEANKAFPPNFNQKVDLRKVNMEVMRRWIEDKVTELLGFEDDVVAEYVCGILESEEMQPHPDPRKLQLSLTGFLESSTPNFTAQLWTLLLSAQDSIGGIPREFVEQKKEEMRLARQRDGEGIQRSAIATASAIASSLGNQQQGGGSGSAQRGLPSRPPVASNLPQRPAQRSAFQDKRGNRTERVSDAGWGARRGGGSTEGDSYRPTHRRSPSPRRRYDDDGDRYSQHRRDDRYAPPRRRHEDDDDEDRYRQRRRVASPDRREYAPDASSSRPRRYTRSPSPDRRRSRSPPRRSRRRSSSRRSYSESYSPEASSRQKQRRRSPSRSISRSRSPVQRRRSPGSQARRSRSTSSRSRSRSPVRREGRGRQVSRSRSISRSRSRSFSRSRSSGSSRSRSRSTRSPSPVRDGR